MQKTIEIKNKDTNNNTNNNLKLLSKLQLFLKKKINIKMKFQKELEFLINVINQIIRRIKKSYACNILTNHEYHYYMNMIMESYDLINQLPKKITFKTLYDSSQYSIMFLIAKVKLNLINIVQKVGSFNLIDILKLILNMNYTDVNNKYKELVIFYNAIFNPTRCDIYESVNSENISFKLYNYGNKNKNINSDLKLTSFQLEYPTCNKISIFSKTIIQKLYGVKLYFPYKNKLIVIYGYFSKDDLNIARREKFLEDKETKIKLLLNDLDIPDVFKANFLCQVNIKNFILLSHEEIVNGCQKAHIDLVKLKSKNVSSLIKEFLLNSLEKQIYYVTILLLDTNDTESHYLAYLLYDLISSDSSSKTDNRHNHTILYSLLHWSVQKIFKNCYKNIQEINNRLLGFGEDRIPYEKRIHLMKTSDYVKSKALDKLKEINNSKGGETNSKAQQYLDGLLKIPFGSYNMDATTFKFRDALVKIEKIINVLKNSFLNIEENNVLSDYSLEKLTQIREICMQLVLENQNTLGIDMSIQKLKLIMSEINDHPSSYFKLMDNGDLQKLKSILNNYTIKYLKTICDEYNLAKNGKKETIINRILNKNILEQNRSTLFVNHFQYNYQFVEIYQTTKFKYVLENINYIFELWNTHKNYVNDYFKNIDETLDNAVYGLKNAKNQIKRIFGQWMNGTDSGYVFGFEGPPGTGKTTLAKKGIASCLQDENGKNRPFEFIALGGSSNGSTLEGHNYTYVGSTWGLIVDSLMKSKCMNPIIYIDELDKISKTEHGRELVGILTHMTDPAQNELFTDKYFSGIKFDISKCLIIFSYNDPSLIDNILLERIHRININALSKPEKLTIAQKYLLPEIYKTVGYDKSNILFPQEVISYIIDTYTYEAGVRKLKQKLYEIIREINLAYLKGEMPIPFTVTKEFILKQFMDYPKITIKKINKHDIVGLVNGLYASSNGLGGITAIEAVKNLTGTFTDLELTGQQGDVMKESMRVARSLAFNIVPAELRKKIFEGEKFGLHIHCPSASTPKDGPSAGTAITLAIISLLMGFTIKRTYGITGEINSQGQVMEIGGLGNKVDGAKAAGINYVLCPRDNKQDVDKIRNRKNPPENENFQIIMIDTIFDAMKHMLNLPTNYDFNKFNFNELTNFSQIEN